MNPNHAKHQALKIHTLSPVHIGLGQDFVPSNYVIQDQVLASFEVDALIDAFTNPNDRQALMNAVALNHRNPAMQLLKLQSMFAEKATSLIAHSCYKLPVSSGLNSQYTSRIGAVSNIENAPSKKTNEVINALAIERNVYNPVTHQPFIPGSSIKGAIKTALLDHKNQGRTEPKLAKKGKEYTKAIEELMGGSFHTDPMHLIQVEDSRNADDQHYSGYCIYAQNVKRRHFKDNDDDGIDSSLRNQVEAIPAMRANAHHSGMTFIDPGKMRHDSLPKQVLDFETIATYCNAYYLRQLEREYQRYEFSDAIHDGWKYLAQSCLKGELRKKLDSKQAFLLRVGRYCGAESMTLEGQRSIRVKVGQSDYKNLSHATTVWLGVDDFKKPRDMLPFGWVLIEKAECASSTSSAFEHPVIESYHDDYQALLDRFENDMKAKLEAYRLAQQQALEAERLAEEKRRQREAQAVAKREAEAAAARAFAALPQDQQALLGYQDKAKELLAVSKEVINKLNYPTMLQCVKEMLKTLSDASTDVKQEAVKLATSLYEHYGWSEPGTKKDKRAKQEAKKRNELEAFVGE